LEESRRASIGEVESKTRFTLSLRTEEGRVVGTAVHLWLERIALDGVSAWSRARVATLGPQLRALLAGEGVPAERLAPCVARVQSALINTLEGSRGRWILSAHPGAASELALTGVFDGVPVHAIIDRTFVDENGVRWVIDYKTSEPAEDETLEAFLTREAEHYRPQLQIYLELLGRAYPREATARGALYFPLLDAWREVE
jgi:ATP-dependent exoDNAse (exonuclease V) beta subunit